MPALGLPSSLVVEEVDSSPELSLKAIYRACIVVALVGDNEDNVIVDVADLLRRMINI